MKITDLEIGDTFYTRGGLEHRCTDIGSRTVTAILTHDIDPVFVSGPPYLQPEQVFDETDLGQCFLSIDDLITSSVLDESKHPGFSSQEVSMMMRMRFSAKTQQYPRQNLLKVDRFLGDDIAHPYGVSCEDAGWIVHYLGLKSKKSASMGEVPFASLPVATEANVEAIFAEN